MNAGMLRTSGTVTLLSPAGNRHLVKVDRYFGEGQVFTG
jgi:hypothetical protein